MESKQVVLESALPLQIGIKNLRLQSPKKTEKTKKPTCKQVKGRINS